MNSTTAAPTGIRWIPLLLAFAAFVGLGALLACSVSQARNDGGSPGDILNLEPAPDFTAPLYSGGAGEFTLSDHLGHPVVLNFWASWCPPCRAEFPALQAIADKYKDEGLVVFGADIQDTEADAKAFLNEQGTTFFTGPDLTGQLALDYGFIGLPATFFITADGRIFKKWVGQIDEERLTTFVGELLDL